MSKTNEYGYRLNTEFGFAAADAKPANPIQSLVASLSGSKVDTKPVHAKQVPVDHNKPNAKAAAAEQANSAHAANKENHGKIASAEKVIKEAAGEILQAAKAAQVEDQLPQRQSGMTGVELVGTAIAGPAMTAASAAIAGKGSLATKGASTLDTAATFKDMSAGGSTPKEAMEAIQDVLVQSSLASDGDAFGTIEQANTLDNVQVSRDWKPIFDQHGTEIIAEIIAYDPNNPSDAFPEMQALKGALEQNNDYISDMEEVAILAERKGIDLEDQPGYTADGVLAAGELPMGFPVDVTPLELSALDSPTRTAIQAGAQNDSIYDTEPDAAFRNAGPSTGVMA